MRIGRRQFLGGGLALGANVLLSPSTHFPSIAAARAVHPAGSDLGAIDHVVFLMQENRSFDHYFGSYRGVRGFDDHAAGSLTPFAQPYPANTTQQPLGSLLPFHLDTTTGLGECTHDIVHEWVSQHQSWDAGAMDAFVSTHTTAPNDGANTGLLTMGYYTRADLPYHYALADAFTICDHYFSSVMGPTDPNRLMAISGTIDPGGTRGGPVLTTSTSRDVLFGARWTSVPELLEDSGISWKSYTAPGQGYQSTAPGSGFGDAILQYFAAYRRASSPLHKKAFLPTYPADFVHDVRTGALPRVSWITPPDGYDEHPPAPPAYGAWLMSHVLSTLVSNPKVWARTVLFVSYDENGGFFDHVAPPVAPASTPGEYVTGSPLPTSAAGLAGPIGLGFRVPTLVVSPFSRGGYLSSDVFDHTSQIRFLEARFGIRSHEISAWRRSTVGDLTATLRMTRANLTPLHLPATSTYRAQALSVLGCTPAEVAESSVNVAPYPAPQSQTMPVQESGTLRQLPRVHRP
ncbi:MAG: phospholipase C [Acidimicrobiales bacterium]